MEYKSKSKKDIVKMLLKNNELDTKDEEELLDLLINQPISIDVDKMEEEKMTKGDKLADKISEVAGSWGFIICFSLFLVVWILLNLTGIIQIDKFPFILLNLLLSCLAALQAPVIMMSQNRQAQKDSIRNKNDYMTDLKTELIIETLHEHVMEILKNERRILKLLEEDSAENEKEGKLEEKQ